MWRIPQSAPAPPRRERLDLAARGLIEFSWMFEEDEFAGPVHIMLGDLMDFAFREGLVPHE